MHARAAPDAWRGVDPARYDAWYHTPRGRWIGVAQWQLLRAALDLRRGDTVLDVGCGTGWFTRNAADEGARATGLDLDQDALRYARLQDPGRMQFVCADAVCLPFADRSFDKVMSVTSLCFARPWPRAVEEIVRVCRHRFALGLLNRNSLLWMQKGRRGGRGAYRGAHWHTGAEIGRALQHLAVGDIRYRFGIFLPGGGTVARMAERALPSVLGFGSFLVVSGTIRDP